MEVIEAIELPGAGGQAGGSRRPRRYPHSGERWTDAEDERLQQGFHDGLAVGELAREHGRSPGGIRSRLMKLGLIDADGLPLAADDGQDVT